MKNISEKIYKAGIKFLMPLTPEETYSTIIKEAMKLVKVDYGSIFLEKNGVFARVYPYSPKPYKMKTRRGFISNAFKAGIPIVSSANEINNIYPRIKEMGIKSIISIPLIYRKRAIGVLTLQSTKKEYFHEKELEILKLFSPLASLAVIKMQLYGETKEALKTRDLFISMAAHELRTPLTTINGYIQLLQNEFLPSNGKDKKISRWVKELSWESLRLTLLINELLEVSRVNTGKLQYVFREHSLREIIKRAIMDFSFNYPDRKIIFENNLNSTKDLIVCDFDKILQVVINLLDNAAKFSPNDSEIYICLNHKLSNLVLVVKDHGKGISGKDLPKVFEGFYKGDKSFEEGMGLGLFLAKNIIEQHHGDINIRSKINKGTAVEIKLPRAKFTKDNKDQSILFLNHITKTADRM